MRRFFLLLAFVLPVSFFSWGQTVPTGLQFLASDGNYYGFDNSNGHLISYSPATGLTTVVNANPGPLTLCLERSDGTFLGTSVSSSGNPEFVTVTLAGQVTPVVQMPQDAPSCPAIASDGNYYGAANGGTYAYGSLYQLTASGAVHTFYNFTGQADGSAPFAPPVEGSDGDLYFIGSNSLLRYSPTTGLAVVPLEFTTAPATPIEASDGNFYTYTLPEPDPPEVIQIQPNGSATEIYAPQNEKQNGSYTPIGGLFITGGQLAVLQPYLYGSLSCLTTGNYYAMLPLSLSGNASTAYFDLGSDLSSDNVVATYFPTLYLGGNGQFFGTVGVSSSSNNSDQQGDCDPNAPGYLTGPFPTTATPIQMSLDKTHVLPGGSANLSWQVNNAFSKTMQQCFGFGGLSGKVPLSGTTTVTASGTGEYVTSIVCGGVETGVATLSSANTELVLYPAFSNPLPSGSPVYFSIYVSNAGTNPPTGTIRILYGSTVLGTVTLQNGVAGFTASSAGVPPGTYKIVASYGGDVNYAPATSPPVSVTIVPRFPTTLTLATSSASVFIGTPVTLAGTLIGTSSNGVPTGNLNFLYGSTLLASVPLIYQSSQGNSYTMTAALTQSTTGLPPGTYAVTAHYAGDAWDLPSTSSPVTVTLMENPVTVALSASPNPVPTGGSFTLTANISGGNQPTGTVLFEIGSEDIASTSLSNGVATVTLPAGTLAAGSYQMTAYYAGDKNNLSATSPPITLTIQ